MGFYPIFADVSRLRCVVIGGGPVAGRRVDGLLNAGAAVTIISPEITDRLRESVKKAAVRHLARSYLAGDLAKCDLVFLATDDVGVHHAALSEARSRGIWTNSADEPENCDFILPAVVRRGELMVAISTGGASPATTRAIREELESYLTADYAELVQLAGEARRELKEKCLAVSAHAWNRALKGEIRIMLKAGQIEQAKALLLKNLGAGA